MHKIHSLFNGSGVNNAWLAVFMAEFVAPLKRTILAQGVIQSATERTSRADRQ